eukprot:527374-Rhodomonas_salina.3
MSGTEPPRATTRRWSHRSHDVSCPASLRPCAALPGTDRALETARFQVRDNIHRARHALDRTQLRL